LDPFNDFHIGHGSPPGNISHYTVDLKNKTFS